MKKSILTLALLSSFFFSLVAYASELTVGALALPFTLPTQEGRPFDLTARKGKWTILYFFPKAETPGCTKQACSFRDNIREIRDLNAEVYGISTNTVEDQAAFAKAHALNFTLLADVGGKVATLYGSKMPVVNLSKRWTFIIGPDLIIRDISKDVDPVKDAKRVAARIRELQKGME